MEARRRRRGRDPAPAPRTRGADEDAERTPGRPADPVTQDIRPDDGRVAAERLRRAPGQHHLGRRPARTHLRADLRRLRELRRPGELAAAY